jgi:hypothetical protein
VGEEDGRAGREGLGLEELLECVDGIDLRLGQDADGLLVGHAVLGDLVGVLFAGEGKYHGHSNELFKRTCMRI